LVFNLNEKKQAKWNLPFFSILWFCLWSLVAAFINNLRGKKNAHGKKSLMIMHTDDNGYGIGILRVMIIMTSVMLMMAMANSYVCHER